MDKRQMKTTRSICNAFLEIRSKKPLERITIKEIAELAEISKATFYLHYKDIYDLSDYLQGQVIRDVLNNLCNPMSIMENPQGFVRELSNEFYAKKNIIDILFSGSQFSRLPENLETEIKKKIFAIKPEWKNSAEVNIKLTYCIIGGYYAYSKNFERFGHDTVVDKLDSINQNIHF